ncbi:Cd(II)/Pb(II)-responsive transcriptional regulator [Massilia yuzhufengensis]|uniref:Transcriptional regulator, MerR family n=1 Tax=Massilia yuzhufengensis TaxID=1164594 RepID=A0A1I1H1L7_9BURK|nr:Cd(II)/Pb(II)-responsive transcriptional regulator [Massilia yuzhufengensis]SFC17432.1 transcriptional regulator, MerR family [Massilia yuzhufengensis]
MLKIGELAARTGCPVETIRYYERIGILNPPQRHANNYRSYGERHVERLQFVRHCRALDMGLDEIRVLLEVRDRPEQECTDVNELLDRHISRVAAKIAELASLERQLTQLRGCCVATRASHACGILHALSEHDKVH